MNIVNILEEIEKVDGEIYERLNPRRAAMKSFFNMGKKISLAAMPLALGSMFQKAYGQTALPTAVVDVLNFALSLEYLEYHFYNHALLGTDVTFTYPTTAAKTAITTIRDHEKAHVDLLVGALGSSARAPIAYADTDFRAGGTFATVYTDYNTFLAVAQGFEDTGVRAYKGQAGNLLVSPGVLQTALQIHSVEARHASHIRQMRTAAGTTVYKPWVSLGASGQANDSGVPQVDAVYAGEDLTVQANVNIANITGAPNATAAKLAAVESFDEPLDRASVITIANLFLQPGKKLS
ncbi:ferritin-like domain-containing protein [Pedobacter sp. HDW13]|uniref:ferritin-like domain-containing protein n=1 Tax=unclassified Pedobacter TaxID=2628915 RepID=UPI000F59A12F|nr:MULTISPECIES: ferritin-like domain-containing protein [unclassified Pedobacter]QIL42439.1 ferritin-like domain-containing protein [Pedobacter sp. HDW13]RQO78919.1 dessication-associated protein [Pedobacter sp. KBW01]